MEGKKRHTFKPSRVLLIIIGILLVLIVVLLLVKSCAPKSGLDFEASQVEGLLNTGRSTEEVQKALNDIVEEGRFAVSINPAMNLVDGRLDVRIENKPANRYYMQVTIRLSEGAYAGQAVYSSGVIRQGYSVETGKALIELPVGFYDAIAEITAIDPETEEAVGSTNAVVVVGVPWGTGGNPAPKTDTQQPENTQKQQEVPDGTVEN